MNRNIRSMTPVAAALLAAAAFSPCAFAADPREAVVDRPLAPEEAAAAMLAPDGFRVTLFAGEPDVLQPIGFCLDDRGRLWVAEAHNYPKHGTDPGDRIVILEDVDGDGRHDRRTVFYDRLNYVTGIEVGFGGVWVVSPPYFYFIPDRDGDDRPDGEPETLLDGFGNHANPHNLANALAWGPDGWLYGTHGRTNWSLVGKPGAPEAERIRFDGGVYRYHPVRRVWESFMDGTTNAWGIDWNDVGDAFVCNCVTPHLYHVIQGAHYEPWRNRDSSRYAYQRIPTIADHAHFVGLGNVRAGLFTPQEDAAGGGHAHCGAMVYLGDSWPDAYRNTFFTNNIHGKRINNDLPRRAGSGYVARHGPDLLRARDPWFTGVTLSYGPDGAVFVCDWSDTGECHNYNVTHRETGRIYKIAHGERRPVEPDLSRLDSRQLAELHLHKNDWFVRHARRLLQERAARGEDVAAAVDRLRAIHNEHAEVPRQLRALWTLHALGKTDEPLLAKQLDHPSEYLRAWGVRLTCEAGTPSPRLCRRLCELAAHDDSAYVRLALASALQRFKPDSAMPNIRWDLAAALLARQEDAADPNLPLVIWYGIQELIDADMERFASLPRSTRIPQVAQFIGRRIASHRESSRGISLVLGKIARLEEPTLAALLEGIGIGLRGQRSAPMPGEWPQASRSLRRHSNKAIQEAALTLGVVFDDPEALEEQRRIAFTPGEQVDDEQAAGNPAARIRALESLIGKRAPGLSTQLLEWIEDAAIGRVAIRGLGEYDDEQTPASLLAAYPRLGVEARQDVVQTLVSRKPWAAALLDAIASGAVPRGDVTAYAARQIHALDDEGLRQRVAAEWGDLRPTPAAKAEQIANYKATLTSEVLTTADRTAGRALFQKTCANCHRLFGDGGAIGPDITGSQRTNLDYLLQTLVDPSAAVASEYRVQTIETKGGRILSGIVVDETDFAITVQSVNERVVVPLKEIEAREVSNVSIMPEGMLKTLTHEQTAQLLAYLMGAEQAP